jgi:hypothetical protein
MPTTNFHPAELAQFTGSETLHRWSALTRSLLSDGALYLAQEAGAFWLFDAIDSHLTTQGLNEDTAFTVARLVRTPGEDATDAELVLDDGNGVIWRTQAIPYTDFPLPEIKLYAVHNGRGWTHMLPSEY